MPEYEYRIKTVSDVRGAVEAKKAYEQLIEANKKLGITSATTERELQRVNAALDTQKGRAGQAALEMNKAIAVASKAGVNARALVAERNATLAAVGIKAPSQLSTAFGAYREAGGGVGGVRAAAGTFGAGAVAVTAATIGAFTLGAKAMEEYANAEERVLKRDTALAQQGLLVEGYRVRLDKLADSLQDLTAISDDRWTEVFTTLTQFGSRPETIDRDVEAVKNLAGILGGDLNAASGIIGRALQGNFVAFSRLGIQFDENATKAQKLQKAYEELGLRGAGQLEAGAKSMHGHALQFKNALDDAFKGLGSATFGSDGKALGILATAIKFYADLLTKTIPKNSELRNAIAKTTDATAAGDDAAKKYAKELEEISQAAERAKTNLQAMTDQIDRKAEREKAINESKTSLKIAEINQKEQEGTLTPQEATRQRNLLKGQAQDFGVNVDDVALTQKRKLMDAGYVDTSKIISTAEADATLQEKRFKDAQDYAKQQADIDKKFAPKIRSAHTVGDENGELAATAERSKALRKLQESNPTAAAIDIVLQEALAKEAKTTAKAVKDKIEPMRDDFLRTGQDIFEQQKSNNIIHQNQAGERRITGASDMLDARRKERGDVRMLPGGGIEGSQDAVRFTEQARQDQAVIASVRAGSGGEQRLQQLLKNRDAEIQNLTRILDALSKTENISRQQQATLRQVEDRIQRLEQWGRNRN